MNREETFKKFGFTAAIAVLGLNLSILALPQAQAADAVVINPLAPVAEVSVPSAAETTPTSTPSPVSSLESFSSDETLSVAEVPVATHTIELSSTNQMVVERFEDGSYSLTVNGNVYQSDSEGKIVMGNSVSNQQVISLTITFGSENNITDLNMISLSSRLIRFRHLWTSAIIPWASLPQAREISESARFRLPLGTGTTPP